MIENIWATAVALMVLTTTITIITGNRFVAWVCLASWAATAGSALIIITT
mgnify:CR=1 FL=1